MDALIPEDEQALEASEEQLALLRELGVGERELEGMTYEDAEVMIDAIRAMRSETKFNS